jgi:hypothetical protein
MPTVTRATGSPASKRYRATCQNLGSLSKAMALYKVAIAAAGFWTLAYLLGAIWSASLSNGQESPSDK